MKTDMPALIFEDGVYIDLMAVERFRDFEKTYLDLRDKEGQLLTAEQIKQLPEAPGKDHDKWLIRRKTINRFLKYLEGKGKSRILEIGCGNGFFSNMMSVRGHSVTGVDVNLTELKLAAAIFKDRATWYYLDVMKRNVPDAPFDIIVFNASFQYFNDTEKLMSRCINMLSDSGEVHILDSPFYTGAKKKAARERSLQHFRELGSPEMGAYYHQHQLTEFKKFGFQLLYKPSPTFNRILRIQDSPFPWVMIKKHNNKL